MYARLYTSRTATHLCHARPDVAPGTYVLSVTSHDYVFDQVRQLAASFAPPLTLGGLVPRGRVGLY
jgi:hypothetical protein